MEGSNMQGWQLVGGSYFSYLLFPLFILATIYRGFWWLLPAALVMLVTPIVDSLAGDDMTLGKLALSRSQEIILEVAFSAHAFAGLTTMDKLFATVSVGMIGSIGITAAHELVHKPRRFSKFFGRLGLANVCYLHFEISHIQGHHVRVGTEDDQSTAWLGESLYRFLFEVVPLSETRS
jgi:alkane 1-monooxygenase